MKKRKRKKNGFVKDIFVFAFCIFVFIMMLGNVKFIFTGKADDINEMVASGDEPRVGDAVSIKVRFVLGWYATLVPWMRDEVSKDTTHHCYAVLDNGEIISIGVKNYSDEYEKINRLIEQTHKYLSGETIVPPKSITFTGVVRKLDSCISDAYKGGLRLMGYSDSSDVYMLEIDTAQKWIHAMILFLISVIIGSTFGFLLFDELCAYINKKKRESIAPVLPEYDSESGTDLIYDEYERQEYERWE